VQPRERLPVPTRETDKKSRNPSQQPLHAIPAGWHVLGRNRIPEYNVAMLSGPPLGSVVTPTLNAGRYLRESIESVLGQDYPNVEYPVVDSYSTDHTKDILPRPA
jgi:cellulose synthase/poly-beta-1,6-N-acetylglucosamine synthase-like glycosyltransferase